MKWYHENMTLWGEGGGGHFIRTMSHLQVNGQMMLKHDFITLKNVLSCINNVIRQGKLMGKMPVPKSKRR